MNARLLTIRSRGDPVSGCACHRSPLTPTLEGFSVYNFVAIVFLLIPIASTWLCFYAFRKSLGPWAGVIIAIPSSLLLGILFWSKSIDCVDTQVIRENSRKSLSEVEISSMQQQSLICPAVYTFKRNGNKECIWVSDGEISIGCG